MLLQVLLMSLKAGGVGLNLTAASSIFLMVLCFFKLAVKFWSIMKKWWWLWYLLCVLETLRIYGRLRLWKRKQSWNLSHRAEKNCMRRRFLVRYLDHISKNSHVEYNSLITSQTLENKDSIMFLFSYDAMAWKPKIGWWRDSVPARGFRERNIEMVHRNHMEHPYNNLCA